MSLLTRTVVVLPLFVVVSIVGGIMITTFDPAYSTMITVSGTDTLGLDSALKTVRRLGGLAIAGLLLVLSAWWITGDLRDDVFQGRR